MPIITLVSTMNKNDKKELKSIIDDIDGMIVTDWSAACTHLTVSKASLTEKVSINQFLYLLLHCIPVFTI